MVSVAPSCGKLLFREFFFQLETLTNQKARIPVCSIKESFSYISVRWLFLFCSSIIFSRSNENSSKLPHIIAWAFDVLLRVFWVFQEVSSVYVLQEPSKYLIKTDWKKREISFHWHVGHNDSFKSLSFNRLICAMCMCMCFSNHVHRQFFFSFLFVFLSNSRGLRVFKYRWLIIGAVCFHFGARVCSSCPDL